MIWFSESVDSNTKDFLLNIAVAIFFFAIIVTKLHKFFRYAHKNPEHLKKEIQDWKKTTAAILPSAIKIAVALLILVVSPLLILLMVSTFNNDGSMESSEEVSENQSQQKNSLLSVKFDNYQNKNTYLHSTVLLEEINQPHPMIIEMYNKFPDWAGHYAPESVIHDVSQVDINNDGQIENVIYYSCVGCNAPARNIDIEKDNQIIFTVEGGELAFENIEYVGSFCIYTALIPRGTGEKKIEFVGGADGNYYVKAEQDFVTE